MRRQNLLRTYLIAAMATALLLFPPLVSASPNNAPSKAVNVQIGAPFSGIWPGTVYQHGESEMFTHWWRLPAVLRPGDQIQIAIDNRLSSEHLHLCLVPPIDDFGADSALNNCNSHREITIEAGQQTRVSMTYEGASGQAFLIPWMHPCCYSRGEAAEEGYGQYTATIERITTLVNIGMAVPAALPSSFTLAASVVYGDNTPAADGTQAVLQWRPVPIKGTTPVPFANLVGGSSIGGVVAFSGAMPVAVQGERVQLRACVAQPGGTEIRCGASGRTLVAVSPCSQALQRQLILSRVVHRLARNIRHHRAGPAKLRLKRKLKAKRRKLARANRSVEILCG